MPQKIENFSKKENIAPKQEDEYVERLEDIYERLGPELEQFWRPKIEAKIEGGDTAESALRELEEVLAKRKKALNAPLHLQEYNFLRKEDEEIVIPNILEHIAHSKKIENLVGIGTVADVYRFEPLPKTCIKIVKNAEHYALGNTLHEEGGFLKTLSEFEESGVRTPKLLASYSFPLRKIHAMVMEELNADTLWTALGDKTPLGERFDFRDYFGRVESYLERLHKEKGIFHFDLHLRNLMIDRETLAPYIIDFGKSKRLYFEGDTEREERVERLFFETSKAEVKDLLKRIYRK